MRKRLEMKVMIKPDTLSSVRCVQFDHRKQHIFHRHTAYAATKSNHKQRM